jgi:PAS domain S-box-containing protein
MRKPRHPTNVTTVSSEGIFSSQSDTPNQATNSPVFRRLLDRLEIGVAQAAPNGLILYANQHFAEILGRPRKKLADSYLSHYIAPASWVALSEALTQGTKASVQGVMNVATDEIPNSGERIIHLSFSPLPIEGVATVGIVATEVTQLLQAEEALEKSEASLQSMSAQLLKVQDEERRRLARDLHDTTGQELSVAIMALDRVANHPCDDMTAARKTVADCTQQLRKVEKDIRTLSYVLHPPLLDEMGLAAALRWYLDGFSSRTGIEVQAAIPDSFPRFELHKETALFRVIQECLANVYRHSGSPRVRVRLCSEGSSIEAIVQDEGRGFKTTDVSAKPKSGVGIQSMRGRLEIIGGRLELRSDANGTSVTVCVPIASGAANDVAAAAAAAAAADNLSAPKRILIADDHYVARRGIRTLFDNASDLEICGEAADGVEAVRQAKELKPDLVILDLSMPKMGGLQAAGRIREAGLRTKILVYTSHSLPQLERNVRLAGCDGYVVKSNASTDLLRATREVLGGGKFYTSEMAKGKSA